MSDKDQLATDNALMETFNRRVERRNERRDFFRSAGAFAAGAAGMAALSACGGGSSSSTTTPAVAQTSTISDADILNFALNLEYLEAEFYLRTVTGQGLSASDIGSNPGTVTGGQQVQFVSPLVKAYAVELAVQERTHVEYLRSALGSYAVSRPNIDLVNSFNALGQAALGTNFNPYSSDTNFLLGSYIFEDVGVTAYHGATALLANRNYIVAAAGIMATEAYHAAIVRESLFALQNQQVANITQAIASTRSALANQGNPNADDHGIGSLSNPQIVDADANAVCFTRTTSQVLAIVYGSPMNVGKGGVFFPSGMNGVIR